MNNVCRNNVRHDAEMEFDQVVIFGGGSVIFTIIGSKGASMDGTESSRPRSSDTESGGNVL